MYGATSWAKRLLDDGKPTSCPPPVKKERYAHGLARVFGMSGADPTMFTEHSHANYNAHTDFARTRPRHTLGLSSAAPSPAAEETSKFDPECG